MDNNMNEINTEEVVKEIVEETEEKKENSFEHYKKLFTGKTFLALIVLLGIVAVSVVLICLKPDGADKSDTEEALFSEGLLPVKVGTKWGYINEKGDIKIEAKFDYAYSFSEGIGRVESGEKYGYINKKR